MVVVNLVMMIIMMMRTMVMMIMMRVITLSVWQCIYQASLQPPPPALFQEAPDDFDQKHLPQSRQPRKTKSCQYGKNVISEPRNNQVAQPTSWGWSQAFLPMVLLPNPGWSGCPHQLPKLRQVNLSESTFAGKENIIHKYSIISDSQTVSD